MADDDLDSITGNLRACIVSCKGGTMSLRNLIRDYETIVGKEIPFRKFNHPTLISFLQSLPTLTVTGSGRDAIVQACMDSTSSHISSMISKQKTATKKRTTWPPSRRGGYSSGSLRGSKRGRGGYYSNTRYTSSRETIAPRRQSPNHSPPLEYNPAPRREVQENQLESSHKPLYVKVDENDHRQVLVGNTSRSSQRDTRLQNYELPPRLQRKLENKTEKLNMEEEDINKIILPAAETRNKIISPLGPSQLIAAASRARQEAEQLHSFPLDPVDNNAHSQEPTAAQYNFPRGYREEVYENTNVHVPVPEPDLINLPRNIDLLEQYARATGWMTLQFKPLKRKTKGRCPYFGTVNILKNGQVIKKYSSFPDDHLDENIANAYAAKIALEELHKEDNEVKAINPIQITSDKSLICQRVSLIVEDVPNGLFSKKVEELYIEQYNELLPDNWVQYLATCPTVTVDIGVNTNIIVPKKPGIQSVPNTKDKEPPSLPSSLLSEKLLCVAVTHITSTTNVWFRLIDETRDELYTLSSEMDTYYKGLGRNDVALSIDEGHYYAAQAEDGFFRVCICSVDESLKVVTASLIDIGESDIFSFVNLYRLPEQFCTLPKQALQCCLYDLEDLSEDQTACKIISKSKLLIGKALVAEVMHREEETGYIRVILYDTSSDVDVNLNDKLLEEIFLNGKPALANEGCAMEVSVASISKRGEVYVQVDSALYFHAKKIIDDFGEEQIHEHKLTSYRKVCINKMYLAKYAKDNQWYRAIVTTAPSMLQNKITVQFLDFGNSETVSITDIVEVDKLSPVLDKLPPQAVKVALHNLPIESLSNAEIAKLHSLLLDVEKVVLIKTIKLTEDSPIVEIFYKNDDNAVVSVNNTIILYRPDDNNLTQRISFNADSHRENISKNNPDPFYLGLKRPELDYKYMEIIAVLVAGPDNFTFHIYKYVSELNKMMLTMQAYYNATAFPELAKGEIKKGAIYAGLFEDHSWYRCVVTNETMVGTNVPVRFCDYGDMVFVPLSKLRDLQSEFRQLPYMAVKGKLSGVVPLHTDWSVDDCIRFKDLVYSRRLYAKAVYIEEVLDDPMEMVVKLTLTDTHTPGQDIDISEILINEQRAVKESK